MKKSIIVLLSLLILACASTKEIKFESNGSLYLDGNAIEIEKLKEVPKSTELIINVDQKVTYDQIMELMEQLKKLGFKKFGLKASIN